MGQPTKQARVDGAQDSSQERVTRRISRLLDLIYKLYASSSRSEPAGETMEASSSVPQPLAVYQQPQKKRGRKPAPFDCGAGESTRGAECAAPQHPLRGLTRAR